MLKDYYIKNKIFQRHDVVANSLSNLVTTIKITIKQLEYGNVKDGLLLLNFPECNKIMKKSLMKI